MYNYRAFETSGSHFKKEEGEEGNNGGDELNWGTINKCSNRNVTTKLLYNCHILIKTFKNK
jgi:hypothetical protein